MQRNNYLLNRGIIEDRLREDSNHHHQKEPDECSDPAGPDETELRFEKQKHILPNESAKGTDYDGVDETYRLRQRANIQTQIQQSWRSH